MKLLTRYLLLLFAAIALSMSQAYAQEEDDDDDDETSSEEGCPWNCDAGQEGKFCWGEDPKTAKEKQVLYSDAYSMKNYKMAVEPLEWLLENTPNLNKSIYIRGEKIYKNLAKKAESDSMKKYYQDKQLAIYDKRIEYFCEEVKVRQKQSQYAFGYWVKRGKEDKAYYEKLYNMYENVYSLAENKTKRSNLIYYMQMTKIMYQLKKIDDDKVIENYDKILKSLDYNIEKNKDNAKNKAKWTKAYDAVNTLFESTLDIDCEFVKTRWAERIKADNDVKLAKKALRFMIKDKCTDDPFFVTVLEMVHKEDPTVGTAKVLYKKYLAEDDMAAATKYMEEAISLAKAEENLEDQAEVIEDRGDMLRAQGKLSDARKDFLKAAELDPSRSNSAYSKIGNLYMSSFKSCLANNSDPIRDRAVYFAAYDMFAKAQDNAGMSRARAQFPTKQDVFLYANKGYKVGGSIGIGCWIGGSSTIRVR